MKKYLLSLLFVILFFGFVFADGSILMPPDYSEKVYMPEQKAVIIWDGEEEQLILESKVSVENISDMAWLIPVESNTKPIVEEADEEIFYALSDLFKSTDDALFKRAASLGSIFSATGSLEVEVIEELKVDIYDVTILKATDSSALIEWLNDNNYSFPQAFPNLLDEYVAKGNTYFIANKINLENKYPDINPTNQDFECAQVISASDELRYYFGNYGLRADILQSSMEYIMPSFPEECEGTDQEAVAVLVSLRLGIATPLKITFAPNEPFYPMKISSLNLDRGTALVYFVSDHAVKDDSGILDVRYMKKYEGSYLSYAGIEQGNIITLLTWEDSYENLEADSVFSERAFDPTLDPDYVPPVDIFLQIIFFILIILLFVILPLSFPIFLIPFATGVIIAKVFEEKNKKKGFFSERDGLYAWITALLLVLLVPSFLFLTFLLPSLLYAPEYFLESLGILILIMVLFLLPYYASMACGFFFRKTKYMKRFVLIPIAVFLLLLVVLFFFSSAPVYF